MMGVNKCCGWSRRWVERRKEEAKGKDWGGAARFIGASANFASR